MKNNSTRKRFYAITARMARIERKCDIIISLFGSRRRQENIDFLVEKMRRTSEEMENNLIRHRNTR